MKETNAAGTEGILLIYPDLSTAVPTGKKNCRGQEIVKCTGTTIVFRVYEYDEDGKHKRDEKGETIFKDYTIRHHDLKIKLLDGHFIEADDGEYYLDYPDMRCYRECETSACDENQVP